MFKLLIPKPLNIFFNKTVLNVTKNNKLYFFSYSLDNVVLNDNFLFFCYKKSDFLSLHKLVSNFFLDVLSTVSIKMEIVGFNYRVLYQNDTHSLSFFIGYANVVIINLPKQVLFRVLDKKNKIFELFGYDRCVLLRFVFFLRFLKTPNPYTGAGIRFYKEIFSLKVIKK
jgi:ribosomal protein L6P/L9E